MNYSIRTVLGTGVALLSFLFFLLAAQKSLAMSADGELAVAKRAEEFYRQLQAKKFDAVWDMLSASNKKKGNSTQYVERLRRSTEQVSLEAYTIQQTKLLTRLKQHAQVTAELAFGDSTEKYISKHRTLWVYENGQWYFEDESTGPFAELHKGSSSVGWSTEAAVPDFERKEDIVAQREEKVTDRIRVADTPISHPYLRVAQDAGLAKKEQLHLDFVSMPDERAVVLALQSNKADVANISLIGLTASSKIAKPATKQSIVMLSNTGELEGRIFTQKIERVENLKGKKVAITGFPHAYSQLLLGKLVSRIGKVNNVQIETPEVALAALRGGEIDGVIASYTGEKLFHWSGLTSIGLLETQVLGISATRNFLEEHKKTSTVHRLLRLHLNALSYFRQNEGRALRIMARLRPNVDITKLKDEYDFYVNLSAKSPYPNRADIKALLFASGIKGDYEMITDTSFLKGVVRERSLEELR